MFLFFFFQAEDGIRDYKVTGVQTCALPICLVALSRRGFTQACLPSRGSPSDRPRRPGAVEDRLMDAPRRDAVARCAELGDVALERPVETIRRAAPHRQHDRIDGLDAALRTRIDVRDDHRRALDGAELRARGEDNALGV